MGLREGGMLMGITPLVGMNLRASLRDFQDEVVFLIYFDSSKVTFGIWMEGVLPMFQVKRIPSTLNQHASCRCGWFMRFDTCTSGVQGRTSKCSVMMVIKPPTIINPHLCLGCLPFGDDGKTSKVCSTF